VDSQALEAGKGLVRPAQAATYQGDGALLCLQTGGNCAEPGHGSGASPVKFNVNVICPGTILTREPQGRGKDLFKLMEQGLTEPEALSRVNQAELPRIPLGGWARWKE